MDIFAQTVEKIVKAQEDIVGPVAVEQAKKVNGLSIDWARREIKVTGNKKAVLEDLVAQYGHLFGRASIEVCKEAVKGHLADLPKDQIPSSLS